MAASLHIAMLERTAGTRLETAAAAFEAMAFGLRFAGADFVEPAVRGRLLSAIKAVAKDPAGNWFADIRLSIDWAAFDRAVLVDGVEVATRVHERAETDIVGAVREFNEFAADNALLVHTDIVFTNQAGGESLPSPRRAYVRPRSQL